MMEVLAHDAKNCVAALRMISMSFDPVRDDADLYRRRTLSAAEELMRLTTQIVRLMGQDASAPHPGRMRAAIADVLQDVERVVELRRALKNIHIHANIDADVHALADAFAVREILVNVMTNAIQHTPEGGTITVEANRRDDEVEIIIRDGGPGLATVVRSTPDTAEERTGIGLRLTKRLVARQSGRFSISTHPDGGAQVCIAFRAANGPPVTER